MDDEKRLALLKYAGKIYEQTFTTEDLAIEENIATIACGLLFSIDDRSVTLDDFEDVVALLAELNSKHNISTKDEYEKYLAESESKSRAELIVESLSYDYE